jgi:hypothetical protein
LAALASDPTRNPRQSQVKDAHCPARLGPATSRPLSKISCIKETTAMSDRFPLPDWFPEQNPWAPWMPSTTPNGAPISPPTVPALPVLPTSTSNRDDSLSFHHGGFNWVETPNGGLLAVHPNGEGVDWVETPSGGLLAFPKRQVQPA